MIVNVERYVGMQVIVLSRVIIDADSVELTARGVISLVKILSSFHDNAVVHAGQHGTKWPSFCRLPAVAYLGGGLTPAPPPFQPTIIFYDGIFACFTDFFSSKTSKFRHSVTKKRKLLRDFVPQTPYRGFAPRPHWGTSVPQTPLCPSFRTF